MVPVLLFLFGFAITGIGGVTFVASAKRLWRVARTPTTPIAKTAGGGGVEIKGRLLAGPSGVVKAPVSGANAVWVSLRVSGTRAGTDSDGSATSDSVDLGGVRTDGWFLVDDGSGELARIEPARAELTARKQTRQRGISEEVARFIGEHGMGMPAPENGPFWVEEHVLAEGTSIHVLGAAQREAKPDANGVANRLVFEAGFGGSALVVTDEPEGLVIAGQIVGMIVSALLIAGGLWLFAAMFGAAA